MISDNGLRLSHWTIPTSTFKIIYFLEFAFVKSRRGSKKKVIRKIPTVHEFDFWMGGKGGRDISRIFSFHPRLVYCSCFACAALPSISQVKSSETNRRVLSVPRKYNCLYSCLGGE
jgi:hypothetical protein